jgi:hypothetical protein
MKEGAAWLIDAHVHFHAPFPLTATFDAAANHFRRWARDLSLADGWLGCLMLAENEGEDRFRDLQRHGLNCAGPWSVHPTGEDVSLLVRHDGHPAFVVVAGRQVVTVDRLEVLTLGTARPLANGSPLEQAVDRAATEQGLAVIPWGFGKWTGRRGARLRRFLTEPGDAAFFVGDNGGRPRHFPSPSLLRRAAARGVWNLPGTDPLPLPGQAQRLGSYGFMIPGTPDLDRPFAQIRDGVRRSTAQPRIYGRRPGLLAFAHAQAALRVPGRR